jgi:hypothetical protein
MRIDTRLDRRTRAVEEASSPGVGAETPWQRIWEVVSVETGSCTIRLVHDGDGVLVAASETSGVLFNSAVAPSAGARGMLARLSDGSLYIHTGGGGGVSPKLAKAKADMTANDTAYSCVWLSAAGVEGDSTTARRPPGMKVMDGTFGTIVWDSGGAAVFIPLAPYVPPSTPGSPVSGQLWLVV